MSRRRWRLGPLAGVLTSSEPGERGPMIQEHDYRLELQTGGSTRGRMTDPEKQLPELEVTKPPEFGGPADVWSPEELFVASVSACLMTTFHAIASNSNLETVDYADSPEGHMERDESGRYRMSSVTLHPRVTITDPDKVDKAYRLLEKAEAACLISRSVQSEIRMEPSVELATVKGGVP